MYLSIYLSIYLFIYLSIYLSRLYDSLVRMKGSVEKNLEGSASVIFFQKSCEDVKDWITEKSEKLEMDDLAKDLTTVKVIYLSLSIYLSIYLYNL